MKNIIFITGIILSTVAFSQTRPFTLLDTVQVEQVIISNIIPVNDLAHVQLYRNNSFSSIDDINERLAGVSVFSRGAYAKEPLLNSFSGGQINVTIDGMKMFGACTDKMDPITSYVEPVNLDKIEVEYGPLGSSYGATVGGSMNMTLKAPEFEHFSGMAGLGYETVSQGYSGYFHTNLGGKKLAYRFSGMIKDHESYSDGNNTLVDNSQFRKINIHQAMSYRLANGGVFKADFLFDDAMDIGYPALPMDVSKASGRVYSLEYMDRHGIGNFRDIRAKLYANTVYHVMDDAARDSLYFVDNSGSGQIDSVYMKMDMPGWSNTYGLYVEGKIFTADNNVLFVRLEDYYNYSKANMTMFMNNLANPGEPPMFAETWPENYRNVTGLYVENKWFFTDRINFSADIRADFAVSEVTSEEGIRQFAALGYDVTGKSNQLIFTFNGYTKLKIRHRFTLSAGAGYGERLPTLSELFGFYLFNAFDAYDYIGNPELKVEKTIHLFANLRQSGNKLKVSFDNYLSFVNDYILGTTIATYQPLNLYATGLKQYNNIPLAILYSSHFQIVWDLLSAVRLMSVTEYNYGILDNGDPLPLVSPLKNASGIYYEKKSFFSSVEVVLSAKQHRVNSDFGEMQTDGYEVFNTSVGYTFNLLGNQLVLKLDIDNLTNTVYSDHLDWGTYNRPGRNFRFTLKYSF